MRQPHLLGNIKPQAQTLVAPRAVNALAKRVEQMRLEPSAMAPSLRTLSTTEALAVPSTATFPSKWGAVSGQRVHKLERVMGIEPTLFAWEARVLPLNDTREASDYRAGPSSHSGTHREATKKCPMGAVQKTTQREFLVF